MRSLGYIRVSKARDDVISLDIQWDEIMRYAVRRDLEADDLPDEIQRWTAKRRTALILSIIKGGRDLGAWQGTAASQLASQRSNSISLGGETVPFCDSVEPAESAGN